MDFADERFVRIYVRDSKTWLRWGWEGQAVFMFTMRKFDQCGRIDDVDDPAEDIALLTGLPVEVVRVGLPRILGSKTFVHTGRSLECPNFIDGQTASRSDSARCREYRVRLKSRREIARQSTDTIRVATDTECVATDTQRGASTRTDPRPTSHDTQTGIPSHPIPNQIYISSSSVPSAPTPDLPVLIDAPTADVARVFDHWKAKCGHPKAKLDKGDKRDRTIRRALKRYSAEDLCRAVDGCALTDWNMGRDPRTNGKRFDDVELICRDETKIDGFIATAEGKGRAPAFSRAGGGPSIFQQPQRPTMTVEEARRQRAIDEGSAS